MSRNRHSPASVKKVSEAEQRIEKRLAELNRSMVEEQSPESNLVGNSDGSISKDTSSVIDGDTVSRAQSAASSGAKVNKKFELTKKTKKKVQNLITKQRTNLAEVSHLDLNL